MVGQLLKRGHLLWCSLSVCLLVCLLGGAKCPLCQEDAELVLEPVEIKHPTREQQLLETQLEPQSPAGVTVAV